VSACNTPNGFGVNRVEIPIGYFNTKTKKLKDHNAAECAEKIVKLGLILQFAFDAPQRAD
jgi:hypothetical protein